MPIYINDGSHDSGSRHGGNNIVWTKGFRRVSLDGGKPLTRSQHFVDDAFKGPGAAGIY